MGFNIGRFIGAVAPFVGAAFGPAGSAIGLGVAAGLRDDPAPAATIGRATQPGPVSTRTAIVSPQFQGGGFGPTAAVPSPLALARLPSVIRDVSLGLGLSTLPSIFGGGGNGKNPISIILAKARAATGGPVTRNKIIEAAKACGLETAAATFGLDVREICLVVVKGRTRRRRGVSAADVRRTKRTIGFASKIRKDLKALGK